jgi:hypothetical protein
VEGKEKEKLGGLLKKEILSRTPNGIAVHMSPSSIRCRSLDFRSRNAIVDQVSIT